MHIIEDAQGFLSEFGKDIMKDSFNYSLNRDLYDGKYRKENDVKDPGKFTGISVDNGSAVLSFENALLRIKEYEGNIYEFTWFDGPAMPLESLHEGGGFHMEGNKAVSGNISISFTDPDIIVTEKDGNEIERGHIEVSGGYIKHITSLNGWNHIFGSGERAFSLNLRGHVCRLWNHDANGSYGPDSDPLYLNIPVILQEGNGKFALKFYANAGDGYIDAGYSSEDHMMISFRSLPMKYYIITGNLRDIYESLSRVTGKPYMPPEWALGFQQSRYSYMNDGEVRSVIDGFRKNGIPLSALYLDIDYMDGYRDFTFNSGSFPDMKSLAEYASEYGTHIITIIEPSVKFDPGYRIYDEALKNGFFIKYPDGNTLYAPVWAGMSAFPDFSRPDVSEWWGSQYDYMLESGVSGFWHDMNEPAIFTAWGDNTMAESAVQAAGRHGDIHNLFGYYMAKAAFEHLSRSSRPFILSRSGWAGISRYAWVWTGDTETSWKELKQNLITILNLSLSGISYTGCDIGGFTGSPTGELFIRWLQMGLFLPLFRVHSSKNTGRREPWELGKYSRIASEIIRMRYRLLPYIYTKTYRSHITGIPIVRPVFWADPSDSKLLDIDDEMMFGDSILVAPVIDKGMNSRNVVFPAGKWYDFYDDHLFSGKSEINAGLERIPFFIAEGSIIPADEDGKMTINVYYSDRGMKGEFYSDNSGSDHLLEDFSVSADGDMKWLREGTYEGRCREYRFRFHGITLSSVNINGHDVPVAENSFITGEKFENAKLVLQK